VLAPEEAAAVAARFGVPDRQVERDHLISHLLAALSAQLADRLVVFGGTALSRTHLPDGRLSEDVDLLAVPSRAAVVVDLERVLVSRLRREFGLLTWDPAPSTVRGATPAVLRSADGLTVRVQVLDPAGYPAWPTERQDLVQRYSDAPAASLEVLTRPAFVASKTAAWHDRRAARDLYDLWGLARLGAVDAEAAALFARLGPTGRPPVRWMFVRCPSEEDWRVQLAGQTRLAVTPAQALASVRDAWAAAAGDDATT